MSEETSSLPTLVTEVLTALADLRTPAPELIARVVARIRVAPVDEIHLGLHVLWPYSRHITREEWLKVLYFELTTLPSAPRLRVDAQDWIEEWGRRRDAEAPKALAELERLQPTLRAYFDQSEKTSAAATALSAILTPDTSRANVGAQESSEPEQTPASGGQVMDPLARHLPSIEDYDCESFWYHDLSHLSDTLGPACPVLLTILIEVRARVNEEDSLFWGVLGRVHEPFASGNPLGLEEKIAAASSEVLALRIRNGYADLLDYLNYFDEYRSFGDDFLEAEYDDFLHAVERASAAECAALFPKLQRLDYGPNNRPPRPVEGHLPIADRLWTTILAKPNLSLSLLARAGLFYWICRNPAQAPPRALVALGRACEGDCFEFWRIPPFLPFWAAASKAAADGDWSLASLCWKRALVDIVIFDRALGPEGLEQVHAFPFDPRFVKEIHAYLSNAESWARPTFRLALELAVDSLRGSDPDGWSQLKFVLLELSRRLGVKAVNEAGLIDLLGEGLYRQVNQETRRLLAEADTAWSSGEQNLDSGADYAIIGWTYRRAIENEWRLRLGDALAVLDREVDPDRATLGRMLYVLRQPQPLGQQLVRRQLAAVVRRDSRIFDQIFLKRASNLIDAYLNEASHRRLDRSQCTTLRAQLLEGRMLHDLLACVQPPIKA